MQAELSVNAAVRGTGDVILHAMVALPLSAHLLHLLLHSIHCSLVGYLSSWSAYAKFRRCNPDAEDPLVPFKKRLMDTLQLKDDASDGALVMRSAVPLILAQGPGTVKAVVPAEECKQWRGQGCFLWTVDVWIGWHAQQSGAACRCTLWKPRCAWG
ncbi:hypothetical protein ACK3TF_003010 [Chlorella vulgaris]